MLCSQCDILGRATAHYRRFHPVVEAFGARPPQITRIECNILAHALFRMGKRIEPRIPVQVPVRIFGTDSAGAVFSQKVTTVNISRLGVELAEVQPKLTVEEIIGLTYASNRAHFRVRWVGAAGSPKAGHVGLLSVSPEKPLWDFPLPGPASDDHQPGLMEQRSNPPLPLSKQGGASHRRRRILLGHSRGPRPGRLLRRDAHPVKPRDKAENGTLDRAVQSDGPRGSRPQNSRPGNRDPIQNCRRRGPGPHPPIPRQPLPAPPKTAPQRNPLSSRGSLCVTLYPLS